MHMAEFMMNNPVSSEDEFNAFCAQHESLDEKVQYKKFSQRLFSTERFAEAAFYADKLILHIEQSGEHVEVDDYRHAEACAYAAGDISRSLSLVEKLINISPDDPRFLTRAGMYYMLQGDNKTAEKFYLKARDLQPEDSNVCDALAHLYGLLGHNDKMKSYGNKALKLKNAESMSEQNLSKVHRIIGEKYQVKSKAASFNPNTPEKNVIAFSLWGENANYLHGAVLNASMVHLIYPGWSCRFYCDTSVPKHIIEKLRSLQADVRVLEKNTLPFFGLFWRFFVADDPKVDRYLVRDCDCILNCQERVAVDEWIASGKHFHIMRDYASHTELMHAGMWGGVRGSIPDMTGLIVDYYDHHAKERTIDQRFLRHYIWPIVKQSHLCHDSHYSCFGSKKFPALGRYPKHFGNVGMNWQAIYQQKRIEPLLNY